VTQILSVITQEYALLVSDRLLTVGDGPKAGAVFTDDECKLVSLCNICGIGYSGLARLGGSPTHEWIAKTLAVSRPRVSLDTSLRGMMLQVREKVALLKHPCQQGKLRGVEMVAVPFAAGGVPKIAAFREALEGVASGRRRSRVLGVECLRIALEGRDGVL